MVTPELARLTTECREVTIFCAQRDGPEGRKTRPTTRGRWDAGVIWAKAKESRTLKDSTMLDKTIARRIELGAIDVRSCTRQPATQLVLVPA